MKQYLLKQCILFVCITGTTLLPYRSFGQLSGNYTIDPAKAASNNNYKNWASAIGDLANGNRNDGGTGQGPGINSAVVFNVYDTLYANVSITIPPIGGTSNSKTITFQSAKGDSSKCRLTYDASTSTADDYVLLLEGANHIIFKQIGFERTSTGTYSSVIQINNNAVNNKFIRCSILGIKQASNTTSGFAYGIGSCIYFTGTADSTLVSKCRLLYGYNGIYCASTGTANIFSDNVIDTSGSSGIYMTGQTSLKITRNTFNMGDFGSSAGQYVSYATRVETSPGLEISNNKIYMLAVNANTSRGIILNGNSSQASNPAMVFNNMIVNSGGTAALGCSGLAAYTCDHVNFHFNNVLMLNTAVSDACAFYHNPNFVSSYIKVLNNNLINKGSGYAYYVPGSNTADLDSINFNNIYSSGSNIGNWAGNNYSSLSSWQSASGKDANSINIDPSYISNSNLHVTNYNLKGKGIPYYLVKDDIDGDIRDANTPDIGADELAPVANDAGIVVLLKPLANVCVGVLSVEAVIRNFGTNNLTKATVNWSVAGFNQTPYNWTGNLSTNARDTFTLGTFNFTNFPNPKFIVKSVLPNGQTDGFMQNDSIIVVRALRAPPANNLGPDIAFCLGDSALIGPSNNPTNSYKWTTISGTTISTKSQIYVKPTTKTSYVLEVTSNSFGCTRKDTIDVNANPKPVADAGSDVSICLGDSAQLGKASQSGFSYSWTSQPSGFTSSLADPKVAPTSTTTYTLEKTITATGCKATDDVKVTVNLPSTPSILGAKNVCKEDMRNYFTTSNTGNSYFWKATGGLIASGQNTNSVTVVWQNPGTGSLQVTETTSFSCKDSSPFSVTVNPLPVADFSVTEECKGSATSFTDLSSGATIYSWDFGDGGSSSQANPIHLYTTVADFPVKLIVSNSFGCADTILKQAVVYPIPVAKFGIIKTGEKAYDFNDSSSIISGSINKWHWEFGDGDTSILQKPNHLFTAAGTFDITLCVTSDAGCKNCVTRNFSFTGLNNTVFSNTIDVFPNPGTGVFQINSFASVEKVYVTNVNGQLILSINPDSASFNIDLSDQPVGIYFVKLSSGDLNASVKLIKY